MAVGPPPPPNLRGVPPVRNAAFYRALGEEQLMLSRRLIEIAGEIQNAADVLESRDDDADV
jgi:hypothetical protein